MWTLIILIGGIVIYFQFFYKEPKSKNSGQKLRSANSKGQNSEAKKPEVDWIFKREIDQPGVPTAINNYRKVLNGYDYKKIVRSLKGIAKIENEVQRNLGYLQLIEPLAELERNGNFEMNEDMPHLFFEHFFFDLFNFLNGYYPAIGAQGQMKNLEDICRFIPELSGFELSLDDYKFKVRDEILKVIKNNGLIYQKDLKNIDNSNDVMSSLVRYNVLEKGKEGKYVIYKIKS